MRTTTWRQVVPAGNGLGTASLRSPPVFYDPSPDQSLVALNHGLWFAMRPEAAVGALQVLIRYCRAGDRSLSDTCRHRRATEKIVREPWAAER